ncbi:ferredoxin family 2Fe-2S iron-sulfur cluster binding protein [Lyticum sinuosum]|uniref:Adrenodoxin-like protein n=1 Tax=Lyticum sinuosum TaxID=1332059 RepID=A0AAE4VK39_9RICK|nr:ferredoxin family 2Fe-2S iron-sulfur cluster binding protein [Lyticum sinuosum]MDZ5761247.1 2Fe-2S ferredoxin [Lyticum sinuosum]
MTKNFIIINFIDKNGIAKSVEATIGLSVLEIARKNNINIEGACGGALACSTCHVIVDEKFYNKLPKATEDEEDMLDLAFDLKPTSRLGCQVIITSEMDGITLQIPSASRNIMLD